MVRFLLVLFISSLCISICADAQTKYASLNHGEIQITPAKGSWCAGANDYDFTLLNTTKNNIECHYFFRRSGKWGGGNGAHLKPGEKTVTHSCNSDGEIVIFVRIAGSEERFPPTANQIDEWKAKDADLHRKN
jgi:hypothetical protein